MRLLLHAVWLLAVLVSPSFCAAAADEKPEETLASLKKELV
jgi:hypothetical protein